MKWIESSLTDRVQRVIENEKTSHLASIESGVPQGGVLSGILFDLYINDLPSCLNFMQISMYADDAKLFSPVDDKISEKSVQEDLDSLSRWCQQWRLRLNAAKCFLIHYRPQKCERDFPKYSIDGRQLPRKTCASDLGIIISDNLKFHEQVTNACKKANRETGIIRRSFLSRNPKFLSNMFKSHVRPHLEHCVQVWNPVYAGDSQSMEKVQNRFSKLLRHGSVMTPEERNKCLDITDHKSRRLRGDLIHIYKMYEDLIKPFQKITGVPY